MKIRKSTDPNKVIVKRIISSALIFLMAFAFAFSDFSYADTAESDDMSGYDMPLREAHRVRVGKTRYCFFVQNNVIMTPKEIAAIKDDNSLVREIIERAGLYIKEPNCKSSATRLITTEDWITSGKSFTLSAEDIASIRQAAPVDGETVRLHMDVLVAERPLVQKKEEASSEEKKEETATTKADTATEEKKEEATSEEKQEETSSEEKKEETATTKADAATEEKKEEATSEEKQEEASSEKKQEEASSEEKKEETTTTKADTAADEGKENAKEDSNTSEDKKEEVVEEEKTIPVPDIELFSTRKLFRPQLLYLVIATENDVMSDDDECEDPDDGGDEELEIPDVPEPEPEPEEILPEYRTIPMADRTGAKLEPTLADGKPVTLEWIEPTAKKTETDKKSLFGNLPGGAAGPAAAALAAAGVVAALIRKKHREKDEQ